MIARKGMFKGFIEDVITNKEMTREEAIIESLNSIESNAAIISTTVWQAELFEYRASQNMGHSRDFNRRWNGSR